MTEGEIIRMKAYETWVSWVYEFWKGHKRCRGYISYLDLPQLNILKNTSFEEMFDQGREGNKKCGFIPTPVMGMFIIFHP